MKTAAPPAPASPLTTTEVADRLGITGSRVRQICIEHEIGKLFGNSRMLTEDDVQRIDSLRGKIGRPKNSD